MAPEEWQHPHIVTPRSAEMSPVTVLDYCCISFAVEQSQSPVRDPINDSLENNDKHTRTPFSASCSFVRTHERSIYARRCPPCFSRSATNLNEVVGEWNVRLFAESQAEQPGRPKLP